MKYSITVIAILLSASVFSQSARMLYPIGEARNYNYYGNSSFSADNAFFLTTNPDNFCIWSRPTGKLLYSYPKDGSSRAQLSPDGKTVISYYGGNVVLTETKTGKQANVLKIANASVGFSNDGKYLLTSSVRDSIDLWSNPDGKFIQRIPGTFYKILFTNDGKYVVSTDGNRYFKWDLSNKKMAREINIGRYYIVSLSPYSSFRISPDGNYIAARKVDSIFLWDINKDQAAKTITGDWTGYGAFDFTSDGKILMSMSEYGYVTSWDINSGKLSRQLLFQPSKETRFNWEFAPDGKKAGLAINDQVRLYDLSTGKLMDSIHFDIPGKTNNYTQYLYFLEFSPDSKNLALSLGNDLVFYSIDKKQAVRVNTYYDKIISAMVSPGNKWLLTSTEDTATLWDMRNFKPVAQMEMGRSNFDCVFNDKGDRLLMWDGRDFFVWSVPDGKKINKIRNPFKERIQQPFISGDGSKIALESKSQINIWDVATGKNISKIPRGYSYAFDHLAFSYDGNYFITAKKDSILVMRTDNGAVVNKMIRDKSDSIYTFIYMSPGDKYIMTHNANHRGATVWNMTTGKKLYHLDDMDPQFSKDGKFIVAGQVAYDITNGNMIERVLNAGDKYTLAREEANQFYVSLNDVGASKRKGIKIEDSHSGRYFFLLPLRDKNYIVYDESDHFDGSEPARALLSIACDDKIITDKKELDKLYVPGLAEKIMKGEKIKEKKISELGACN